MNIFRLFESKKIIKICSKTHQIARFKKVFLGEACPRTPLANAWQAPPQKKKSWPFNGKACICPWTTTEKFI